MEALSPLALIFLGYTCLLLPALAVLSRVGGGATESAEVAATESGETDATPETAVEPSRASMYVGALFVLGGLITLGLLAAREFELEVFAMPRLGGWEIALGVAVLGASYGINGLVVSWMSEDERRAGEAFIPKTATDWAAFTAAALLGGVAEEVAYRGVALALLTEATGSVLLALAVCVVSFAVGHSGQGKKAVVAVAVGALLFHLLVHLTDTLVVAMVVHVVYDLTAVAWGARKLAREGVEALVKRP